MYKQLIDAIELCQLLEDYTKDLGWHVALTGGVLYKTLPRKDIDIILYKDSSRPNIPSNQLIQYIKRYTLLTLIHVHHDVAKYTWKGYKIDLIFHEGITGYK